MTTFLIINCASRLFGTQGRPKGLRPFFYKQETGLMEGFLYPGGPLGSCLASIPPFL